MNQPKQNYDEDFLGMDSLAEEYKKITSLIENQINFNNNGLTLTRGNRMIKIKTICYLLHKECIMCGKELLFNDYPWNRHKLKYCKECRQFAYSPKPHPLMCKKCGMKIQYGKRFCDKCQRLICPTINDLKEDLERLKSGQDNIYPISKLRKHFYFEIRKIEQKNKKHFWEDIKKHKK